MQITWSIWSSRNAAGRDGGVGLGFGGCRKRYGGKDPSVLLGTVLAASPVFSFVVMFILVPKFFYDLFCICIIQYLVRVKEKPFLPGSLEGPYTAVA